MKVKDLLIIIVVILAIVIFIFNNPFKKKNSTVGTNGKETVISSLSDLFPSKIGSFKYKEGDNTYTVKITNVTEENGVKTVVTESDMKQVEDGLKLVTNYEISSDKVIESGEYQKNGQIVSTIYPLEIVNGIVSKGVTWKSVDGLTTNTVTSMVNNQVTIESTRETFTYPNNSKQPTKSIYKETRVYEKGKGIVLYKTEVIGDSKSITEKKMV